MNFNFEISKGFCIFDNLHSHLGSTPNGKNSLGNGKNLLGSKFFLRIWKGHIVLEIKLEVTKVASVSEKCWRKTTWKSILTPLIRFFSDIDFPAPTRVLKTLHIHLHFHSNQAFLLLPGKTRTKDKYRVVYSDHQRLELEKEFHYSRYITIRRKAELAQTLALSERQVKIWFQNRRAKERKQNKKRDEATVMKMGDMSPELAEENKQQIQQHMNLQMNAHAQHQIRLQTPSPSPVHGQPQYQVPTQCQGHSLQTSESPLNAISPSHSASPNHLFSPQGQLAMTMSPVNAHTSPASCSVTPPITIKTDLDAQDSMTSCV